jgi:hypothetical protein
VDFLPADIFEDVAGNADDGPAADSAAFFQNV